MSGSGIDQRLTKLRWCDKMDRNFVAHCNHVIRWARKMLKQYGDDGDKEFYLTTIHNSLRARAKTKAAMIKQTEEIKLFERLQKLA